MVAKLLWIFAVILVVWAILTLFDILVVGGQVGTIILFVIAVILIFAAMRAGGPPV